MNLQEKLLELSHYKVDFRLEGEWFIIGIQYNDGWQIIEPSNPKIEHDSKDGRYYYCASIKEIKVEEVFECIDETIEHNKDLERKVKLFQEKIKKLQDIFSTEEYDVLETLEFKFKKHKKKMKSKNVEEENNINIPENKVVDDNMVKPSEPIIVDDGIQFVDTMSMDI